MLLRLHPRPSGRLLPVSLTTNGLPIPILSCLHWDWDQQLLATTRSLTNCLGSRKRADNQEAERSSDGGDSDDDIMYTSRRKAVRTSAQQPIAEEVLTLPAALQKASLLPSLIRASASFPDSPTRFSCMSYTSFLPWTSSGSNSTDTPYPLRTFSLHSTYWTISISVCSIGVVSQAWRNMCSDESFWHAVYGHHFGSLEYRRAQLEPSFPHPIPRAEISHNDGLAIS